MAPIATYVFFDLGTTGLLDKDPKITELHMIAIKCNDLKRYFREREDENLATPLDQKELHWRHEDKFMLSQENFEECILLDDTILFLARLKKPVCLIAHNGNRFDFPLLLAKLKHVEDFSPKDIFCADSMAAFYDILEPNAAKTSYEERKGGSFPWPDYYYDKLSYHFQHVFRRVCRTEEVDLEDAEGRTNALVKMALTEGFEFMLWVAENNCPSTSFLRQHNYSAKRQRTQFDLYPFLL